MFASKLRSWSPLAVWKWVGRQGSMSIPAAFSPCRGHNRCGFTYTPSIPLSDEIIRVCRERLILNTRLEEGQGSQALRECIGQKQKGKMSSLPDGNRTTNCFCHSSCSVPDKRVAGLASHKGCGNAVGNY